MPKPTFEQNAERLAHYDKFVVNVRGGSVVSLTHPGHSTGRIRDYPALAPQQARALIETLELHGFVRDQPAS